MKIVIATGIYPPDVGGPATYTRAMARALLNAGHAVDVVCYGDATDEDDVFVHRVKRSVLPIRYIAFAMKTYRLAKNADLVYLQGPVSEGFPGTLGAILARKPTVMKIVGDYAWEVYMQEPGSDKVLLDEFVGARLRRAPGPGRAIRKSIKIRLIEAIERWTAKRARKIIVPSAYLKRIVMAWGVPEDHIHVIVNAIEPLTASMDRETARKELHVEGKRVLFTLVRCVPWKHVDFILNVLRDLPPDVQFVVGGDGPELSKLQEKARTLGVESRVTFTGRLARTKAADWYLAADLFVLPSGYEGFPHVVPEAASVGLHSFVSDRGGNPETRMLLGADHVTVLPYLDKDAWSRALSRPWPSRMIGTVPAALSFPMMVNHVIDVLKYSV